MAGIGLICRPKITLTVIHRNEKKKRVGWKLFFCHISTIPLSNIIYYIK